MRKITHRIAVSMAVMLALGSAFFFFRKRPAAPPAPARAERQYSYFSTSPVFDAGYAAAAPQSSDGAVRGILVPHHLLAARLIAEAFETISTDRAVTVVLISPNHFSAGKGKVITTASDWRTPYGPLPGDAEAVRSLEAAGAVTVEEDPFTNEHGVSGIVPFIRKSLPNARVVPVIVRDTAGEPDVAKFAEAAKGIFGRDAIFVASFDFSHEMTAVAAGFHDRKSLAVVSSFDDAGVSALDVDSMPGLRLSMRLLKDAGAERFSLLARSDSSVLSGRPDQPDVTSYLVGTFMAGERTSDDDVTLLALGDMMLARGVEAEMRRHGPGYPFERLPRLFKGSDIVTANAEGVFFDAPIAKRPVKPDDLRFPLMPSLLPLLQRIGFTHFGLANNHAMNFGASALAASRGLLRGAGIEPFGDPSDAGAVSSTTVVRERRVAQIGYHQFSGHGPDNVLAAIAEAKRAGDFVAVYPHWGVEYQPQPTRMQVALAHRFIDAGADVVLGAHPHVIQPVETYKGKAIFYSLGNFIFDQSFSPETSRGLAVGIADSASGTTFYLLPIDIKRAQASLMPYDRRSTLLQKLADDSVASDEEKSAIASGIFTLTHSP